MNFSNREQNCLYYLRSFGNFMEPLIWMDWNQGVCNIIMKEIVRIRTLKWRCPKSKYRTYKYTAIYTDFSENEYFREPRTSNRLGWCYSNRLAVLLFKLSLYSSWCLQSDTFNYYTCCRSVCASREYATENLRNCTQPIQVDEYCFSGRRK